MRSPGAFQVEKSRTRVDSALGADTAIALENLFAEIARVGAKLPFVDAPIGTEREAPRRDFQVAPAAQRPSAGSGLKRGPVGKASGHGAGSTHNIYRIICFND